MLSEKTRNCRHKNALLMPRLLVLTSLAMGLLAGDSFAQDPFVIAPNAYKIKFENDWVRVVRVHYGPFEKIGPHDHPQGQTIFIYLNDSGEVRFQHVEGFSGHYPAIRPPTKAGAFRLARVQPENHEVENLSNIPSDFLQVELKTQEVDPDSFRGRSLPEAPSAQQPADYRKIEFDNAQVRITRLVCKSRVECSAAEVTSGALLVALSPLKFRSETSGKSPSRQSLNMGETSWLAPGSRAWTSGSIEHPAEQLLIEFKSKPVKTGAGDKH